MHVNTGGERERTRGLQPHGSRLLERCRRRCLPNLRNSFTNVQDPLDWLYEFCSLAEDIVAVLYFGKHNSQILLFLVFMLEPIVENIFKTLAAMTKTMG